MKRFLLFVLSLALMSVACTGTAPAVPTPACQPTVTPSALEATSRDFYMGFTRWPPEATLEGIARMNTFLTQHGDMTALHFDGGIPWPEALAGNPLPEAVMNEWRGARDAIPASHKIYLAITPINMERNALAPYWGTATNQPLPKPWSEYSFGHPDVKLAYLKYALQAIEFFHPDYLAIGIEVNVVQVNAPQNWAAYRELQKFIYDSLKQDYPDLPIFATFTVSHMNGLDGGDSAAQMKEIESLLPYTDLIALSAYPYGWAYESGKADPIPDDFFAAALSFGKPIAIAESGAPSYDFSAFGKNYHFTEEYQARWVSFLLSKAREHNFHFVVAFTGIDYDKLLEIIPKDTRELAMIWVYDGLERSDGCAKQALPVWDQWLALPYQR